MQEYYLSQNNNNNYLYQAKNYHDSSHRHGDTAADRASAAASSCEV
jgi:hypothetical protein